MSEAGFFAGKAEQYARYRADYPAAVISAAFAAVGLENEVVADLGAGTGMLSRWLLECGNRVFAVEPDPGMRRMAESLLGGHANGFVSVAGAAEATGLADASVQVVTVGNAFHYFDPARTRAEVDRILGSNGRILLLGHDAVTAPNDFMSVYLDFLASIAPADRWRFHQPDREARSLATFFGLDAFRTEDAGQYSYPLSWDDLAGRFLSTSLAPDEGERRAIVLARLAEVFGRFEQGGTVDFQMRWKFQYATLKA